MDRGREIGRIVAVVQVSILVGVLTTAALAQSPEGGVGGSYTVFEAPISDAQLRAVREEIRYNVARLRSEGRLAPPTESAVLLSWPLRQADDSSDFGYHGISGFVDQDSAFPNQLLDYNCGQRTYDLSNGYNHRGTDIFTWPEPWKKMADGAVEIVAGAPGTIVFKDDGHPDQSCGFNSLPWNAVYVMHVDGSIAWYGHMKTGSTTFKGVGDSVVTGEYLGVVGSSGSSTGPHLHLELWGADDLLRDPFQGTCNSLNSESWWIAQLPYFNPGVNKITTGLQAPDATPPCPNIESSFDQKDFDPGDRIYFTTYYRDQRAGIVSTYVVRRPDGSQHASWQHHMTTPPHFAASYWWWWVDFPIGVPAGNWSFSVTFEGQTYVRYFNIGPAPAGQVGSDPAQDTTLKMAKTPQGIKLDWGASCLNSDSDYVVYQGNLHSLPTAYDHGRIACSTGGLTRKTLLIPPSGDVYFLVAPRNASTEGVLGFDGLDRERPPGTPDCADYGTSCP